jgi:RNA polymerase nonessential primary-like sigma factor
MIDFIMREVDRLLLKRLHHRLDVEGSFWANRRPTNNVLEVAKMADERVVGGRKRGFSLIPLEVQGRVVESDLVQAGMMARHLGATIGANAPREHKDLTLEHEQSYVARFALGDVAAAWEYINLNSHLVIKLARKARKFLPKNDLPDEDIFAEGKLGAFEAFKKWDPNSGRFSTYAYAWILSHLQGRAAKGGSTIGVRQEVHLGLSRAKKHGTILTESEVALEKALFVASIDEKVGGDDGKERSVVAAFASPDDVEGAVGNQDYSSKIRACLFEALQELSLREREIVLRRMYSTGETPITLEQIGHEFGVSRERVRQIETTAHKKLRNLIESKFGGAGNVMVGMVGLS